MADGNVVPSRAVWHGKMKLGNIEVEGEFEVFDSKGSWEFLLGKPLLRLFGAKQDFLTDTVTICGDNGSNTTVLHNEITQQKPSTEVVTMNCTANTGALRCESPPQEKSHSSLKPNELMLPKQNLQTCHSLSISQQKKGPIQIQF